MSFPALTAFVRNFESTPAEDREEHALNLDRVRELSSYVKSKGADELHRCLEAASTLASLLSEHSVALDLGAVKGLVERTLKLAEELVESSARNSSGAMIVEEEAPRETPAVTATAKPKRASKPPELVLNHGMVLGRLLIEMGHATRAQAARALKAHRKMGLPLGECFLMHGAVAPDDILLALRMQERIRTGSDFDAALQRVEIQRVLREQCNEQAQRLAAMKPEPVTAGMQLSAETYLGEILLGLGLISNQALERGMHIHHIEGKLLGQALLGIGALSEAELEQGLELQRRLRHVAGH